jgi:16S rRNA (guanine(527)-N(7))-methyltransferase RsmG
VSIVSRETPLDSPGFAALTGTPEAELARLSAYLDLLRHWQRRINLVGPVTLADPWRRHFLDSAQLLPLLPAAGARVIDLGSGAGFPGLVLAILSSLPVDLVDSDARKCAFLAEAARSTGAPATVRCARIESLPAGCWDVVTARALAPLPQLLAYAAHCLAPGGSCLLLKGRRAAAELTAAEKSWKMRAAASASRSDPQGVVLKIEDLSRRDDA